MSTPQSPINRHPAVYLIFDILSNTNKQSVIDFLELQCGFTFEEAESWFNEAKLLKD